MTISFVIPILPFYLVIRTILAAIIWRREVLINFGIPVHIKTRRLLFHLLVNPEWSLLKSIIFVPVWLLTGSKYGKWFASIKFLAPKIISCAVCKDTGMDGSIICSCEIVKQVRRAKIKREFDELHSLLKKCIEQINML